VPTAADQSVTWAFYVQMNRDALSGKRDYPRAIAKMLRHCRKVDATDREHAALCQNTPFGFSTGKVGMFRSVT
jgi:hypothetical protein